MGTLVRVRALAIAGLLLVTAAGASGTTIDQDTTGIPGPDIWVDSDARIAQTFRVGQAGILGTLELSLAFSPFSPGSTLDLHRVGAGFDPASNPDAILGTQLATVSLGSQPVLGALVIDLSGLSIGVASGELLAFVVSTGDVLSFAGSHSYAGGAAFYQCTFDRCLDPLGPSNPELPGPGSFQAVEDVTLGTLSFAFRTSLVPEPSLGALLGVAVIALRRRRG